MVFSKSRMFKTEFSDADREEIDQLWDDVSEPEMYLYNLCKALEKREVKLFVGARIMHDLAVSTNGIPLCLGLLELWAFSEVRSLLMIALREWKKTKKEDQFVVFKTNWPLGSANQVNFFMDLVNKSDLTICFLEEK